MGKNDLQFWGKTSCKKHYMQFKEWNTDYYGSGTGYAPGSTFTMGTSDVTLYAMWEYI